MIPTKHAITISTNAGHTIDVSLSIEGTVAVQAHDGGVGGPAITGPGFAGIRADVIQVEFESDRASEE